MKTLLFAVALAVPSFLVAQSDSAIAFREVVSVQGVPKDLLFERAKAWFNAASKSTKLVLKTEDKEKGELTGKGVLTTKLDVGNKQMDSRISYDLYLKVINGRYLMMTSNFVHEYVNQEFSGFGLLTSSGNSPVKLANYAPQAMNDMWTQIKQEVVLRIEPLMDKLQVAMKQKATADVGSL